MKLSQQFQQELREPIYRGEGLLEAGGHDQRNDVIDDALGIKSVGKSNQPSGIDLLASPISAGGHAAYPLPDKTLRAVLTGAQAQGHATDLAGDVPVVTTYGFGDGRSVYGGFDLLLHATDISEPSLFSELLVRAPGYVQPEPGAHTGRVVPVTLTLTNEGIETPGQVVFTLPAGSQVADPGPAQLTGETELTWAYTLAEGADATVTFWLRLPDTEGPVSVQATIQVGEAGAYTEHTTAELDFDVTQAAGLDAALAQVSGDPTLKLVEKDLNDAQAAIADADYDKAMKSLVKAADRLAGSASANAPAIRRMVGQAIFEVGRQL